MVENEEVFSYNEKYEILHLVAQGSFGKVYKSVHRESGKFYAIKVRQNKHFNIHLTFL
jgi:serine/threonine protein kinase